MKKSICISFCLMLFGLLLFSCAQKKADDKKPLVQAHRGGAALNPENTVGAFKYAVEMGVPIMEMDLHVTKDSMVVVSHDAFMNSLKVLKPNGDTIAKEDELNYKIYEMTYDSLAQYDVGSKPNPNYPNRVNEPAHIPLASNLIDSIEYFVKVNNLPPVDYNIEIKSDTAKDNIYSPDYKTFADLCMNVLLSKNLGNRLLVQCFDPRTLNYIHQKYPNVQLAYLVEDKDVSFKELMSRIDFVPQVYSPESDMLTPEVVKEIKAMGMKISPWTVDNKAEVERLVKLGVDDIITNQPDSVMIWLGYPLKNK